MPQVQAVVFSEVREEREEKEGSRLKEHPQEGAPPDWDPPQAAE